MRSPQALGSCSSAVGTSFPPAASLWQTHTSKSSDGTNSPSAYAVGYVLFITPLAVSILKFKMDDVIAAKCLETLARLIDRRLNKQALLN